MYPVPLECVTLHTQYTLARTRVKHCRDHRVDYTDGRNGSVNRMVVPPQHCSRH